MAVVGAAAGGGGEAVGAVDATCERTGAGVGAGALAAVAGWVAGDRLAGFGAEAFGFESLGLTAFGVATFGRDERCFRAAGRGPPPGARAPGFFPPWTFTFLAAASAGPGRADVAGEVAATSRSIAATAAAGCRTRSRWRSARGRDRSGGTCVLSARHASAVSRSPSAVERASSAAAA